MGFFCCKIISMMQDYIIEFNNIQKTYHTELKRKSVALSGLELKVLQGEVFGIIGPNGAGKSTALKILMGFVKPSSGTVTLLNSQITNPLIHSHIGFLPENPCLYEHLTVKDHLHFAGKLSRKSKKERNKRIEELLQLVDLRHAENLPIRRYSKGMTQRAALAYALFDEPEILILDEPMSGLDPIGKQLVVDIIRNYNRKGHTILFCSHILTDVERICNRIGIMHQGKIVATQTPEQLVNIHTLQEKQSGKSPLESFFLKTVATR